jgi:hypothetical protein
MSNKATESTYQANTLSLYETLRLLFGEWKIFSCVFLALFVLSIGYFFIKWKSNPAPSGPSVVNFMSLGGHVQGDKFVPFLDKFYVAYRLQQRFPGVVGVEKGSRIQIQLEVAKPSVTEKILMANKEGLYREESTIALVTDTSSVRASQAEEIAAYVRQLEKPRWLAFRKFRNKEKELIGGQLKSLEGEINWYKKVYNNYKQLPVNGSGVTKIFLAQPTLLSGFTRLRQEESALLSKRDIAEVMGKDEEKASLFLALEKKYAEATQLKYLILGFLFSLVVALVSTYLVATIKQQGRESRLARMKHE